MVRIASRLEGAAGLVPEMGVRADVIFTTDTRIDPGFIRAWIACVWRLSAKEERKYRR
jgi:hypothetical protein